MKPDTSPFATSSSLPQSKLRSGFRAAPRFTSGVSLPRFLFVNIRASHEDCPSDLNDHFFKASRVFIQHLALLPADHYRIGVSNASVWIVDSRLADLDYLGNRSCRRRLCALCQSPLRSTVPVVTGRSRLLPRHRSVSDVLVSAKGASTGVSAFHDGPASYQHRRCSNLRLDPGPRAGCVSAVGTGS